MSETTLTFSDETALKTWLMSVAQKHNLDNLLTHADDGVNWGKFEGTAKSLKLSHDAFPKHVPPLSPVTLQQARAFGEKGEVRLWRGTGGWHSHTLLQLDEGKQETTTERQLLWGDQVDDARDGFSLLREGAQGMLHAVPIALPKDELKPRVRLVVRHWVGYDGEGQAHIENSRLVRLEHTMQEEA